jgi:hypothetical protein
LISARWPRKLSWRLGSMDAQERTACGPAGTPPHRRGAS